LNRRKLTSQLSHSAIKDLQAATVHARHIGLPLNTHVSFVPYRAAPNVPDPAGIAATFGGFLRHLSVWSRRRTSQPFTYIRVAHSEEDGSGLNPHLHVFMHLPRARLPELQAALLARYGYCGDAEGHLVAKAVAGSDTRVLHQSGYWGSTFDYITRHKSQQAYIAQGRRVWRASRVDENGRHRGIKCPFVGRRCSTSRNINARSRSAFEADCRSSLAAMKIAA
jgi:hypothetical protein